MATEATTQQTLADGETKTCAGCKGEISGGQHYIAIDDDHVFHSDCFKCAKCSNPLADKPYMSKDDKFYCEPCYIDEFHPKCGGCGKGIEGKYMTALGSPWHPDCFVCTKCSAPFTDDKYHAMENKPYCDKCYHAEFGDKCAKCGEPITGGKFEAAGKLYHDTCFVCCVGDHKLGGDMSFQMYEGKIYCPEHYKEAALAKCKGCGEFIEGQFFTDADKNTYHGKCLKCYGKKADGSACENQPTMQGSSGNFFCGDCAKQATAPPPAEAEAAPAAAAE